MPKVSVILTSFNHQEYLPAAIESVLSQDYEDFELIIYDDCSTDNSWAIIQGYKDKRIRSFRSSKNERGLINKALPECKGEYIAIHHSDDVWASDKLRKQKEILDKNPSVGMVATWVQMIDEVGSFVSNDWFNVEPKSRSEWILDLMNGWNHICHPSVMVRKQVYEQTGAYRRLFFQLPDAEMWLRILGKNEIHLIPEKLTFHRRYEDGRSTSGTRTDVFIRTRTEVFALGETLKEYPLETLFDLFPSLGEFRSQRAHNVDFLVAWAAIHEGKERPLQAFGLASLYSLLRSEESRINIEATYGFDLWKLIEISGRLDVFNEYALKLHTDENAFLKSKIDEQASELNRIHKSISWKITAPLRRFKHFLFQVTNH